MIAQDLTNLGATEIAALIASGDLGALEVTDAKIVRIQERNPSLNALVAERFDAARKEAQEIDQKRRQGAPLPPLAGVPTTIKEALDVAGLPSTGGIPSRRGHRAARDCAAVGRLKAAGAVILGKSNVAQTMIFAETDNPLFGRTTHPLDPTRTPGGSSGGEAALIAAGCSVLGLGTDLGGSVRIPAAFCGIASLKPTAGRLPDPQRLSVPIGALGIPSQLGPMAARVADVESALGVLNPFAFGLRPSASVDLSQLRVGVYEHDGVFPASPGVRRVVRTAASTLREHGATVVDWTIPEPAAVMSMYYGILSADGASGLRRLLRGSATDVRVMLLTFLSGRSRATSALLSRLASMLGQAQLSAVIDGLGGRSVDALWQLHERQMDYQELFAARMDDTEAGPLDLLIGPPVATPAFTHGATKDLGVPGIYTTLFNFLGYPAGVVPSGKVRRGEESDRRPTRDLAERAAARVEVGSVGLPLAVQVAGRPWCEHHVLAAMAAIEKASDAESARW